jgi:hypothetical protein
MTDDEKRQQKAMLLLDFHEAERNLAHLKEKAQRKAMRVKAVADWLTQATQMVTAPDTVNASTGYVNIVEDPEFEMAMNFDAISKLVRDLREAYIRVADLTKRKTALGL